MIKYIFISVALLIAFAGCSSPGTSNADSQASNPSQANTRQGWAEALQDSVASIQAQYDRVAAAADSAKGLMQALLQNFEVVQDPLLVEPYRVVKGWSTHDTTGKQGILARALEDGTIEIVVTAAVDFDFIELNAPGGASVRSQSVPRGNALHTVNNGLNRVAFNDAASLAKFVYDNSAAPEVSLSCGGAKEFKLNAAQRSMIADTYRFTNLLSEVNELDRQQSVLYNKLLLCTAKLDELEKVEKSEIK